MSTIAALKPLFTLHLQATQQAWECVPNGTEIAVLEGVVCVHLLTYLAGMWVELPMLLREGERHRVEGAGWMRMEAVGAARVSGVARPGWGAILLWLCYFFNSALRRLYLR